MLSILRRLFRPKPDFSSRTFVARAMMGEFEGLDLEDVIDDAIEAWHSSDSTLELHEYLGFTWDEYGEWVAAPRTRIEELLHRRAMKR
jgi:hypothetical protein